MVINHYKSILSTKIFYYLRKDLKPRVKRVSTLLKGCTVSQNQFDSLVDFEYTTGALHASDLPKYVKKNAKLSVIKKDFRSWCRMGTKYYKGLWARRNDEFQMYKSGNHKRNKNGENSAPKNYI